jgi:hypothetical protein
MDYANHDVHEQILRFQDFRVSGFRHL